MATRSTARMHADGDVETLASVGPAHGYPITASAFDAVRERVRGLREEMRREIAGRLHEARVFGEPSANDEYMAIREDEGVLQGRIAALEELIRRATVIDPGSAPRGVVAIGSTVATEDLEARTVERLRIVDGPHAGDPGTVSAASPAGRALVGQRVGAEIEIPLPDGRRRTLRVLDVAPGCHE